MSIIQNRNLELIANIGGVAHHTGWFYVDGGIAPGRAWYAKGCYHLECTRPVIKCLRPLTVADFVRLTGWAVRDSLPV